MSLKPWKAAVPPHWLDRNLGVSFIHCLELRYRWDPVKLSLYFLLWGWGLQAVQKCWLDPLGLWATLLSPQCQEQEHPFLFVCLRVLTPLCFSANAGMWREALGCSFTHLGIKSSEKGSVQVDSSMLHLSLQPRRAERSRLMAAVLKEEAKVWGLDLSAGLCHGFVHAIWWCSQVWWLELCWPKRWWSQAQMLVLAARWDHFHYNNDWSDACNEIKQNIYRQTMLQCSWAHAHSTSCPLSTSRWRVSLPSFYTLTSSKVLHGGDSRAELCLQLLLRVCGEEWNVKDKETLVFIKSWLFGLFFLIFL